MADDCEVLRWFLPRIAAQLVPRHRRYPGAGSDYAAEYGFVHRRRRRILWLRHDYTSAMYQHMFGVAGFTAAADYLYSALSLYLFGVAGSTAAISDYSYSSS
jgi:hypothetical protein